jgi:hypothetical protein
VEIIKEKSDFLRHPLMQVGAWCGWLAVAPHAAVGSGSSDATLPPCCQFVPGCSAMSGHVLRGGLHQRG